MSRKPRAFYAIVYAYGRNVPKNGSRADYIHRFETIAERTRFMDLSERAGNDADPIEATHPLVLRALRFAKTTPWPQAV